MTNKAKLFSNNLMDYKLKIYILGTQYGWIIICIFLRQKSEVWNSMIFEALGQTLQF